VSDDGGNAPLTWRSKEILLIFIQAFLATVGSIVTSVTLSLFLSPEVSASDQSSSTIYLADIMNPHRNPDTIAKLVDAGNEIACYKSLVMPIDVNYPRASSRHVIPHGYDYFHARVGAEGVGYADHRIRFSVLVDGRIVRTYELARDEATDVSIPVAEKDSLEIVAEILGTPARQTGAVHAVWGDARFTAGLQKPASC
jgi:hypothetical protein